MSYESTDGHAVPFRHVLCDRCGATAEHDMDYSGVPRPLVPQPPDEQGFHPSYFIEPMLPADWSHTHGGLDLCPDCASNARVRPF